jgi:membrane protease YdiL (CAAX protease family)
MNAAATEPPPLAHRFQVRDVFLGPQGLRAGWGLLLYIVLVQGMGALLFLALKSTVKLPEHLGFTPGVLIVGEAIQLVFALAGTAILGRIEKRPLAAYGIPLRPACGRLFWRLFGEGALWGILSISAVIGMTALAGGYAVSGLAVHGAEALRYGVLWALALLGVGLYEEIYFRGYPLATLTRGTGFWPAALLLSFLFGALHYFQKPMETWMDFASVGLIGLFFCDSIRRTGSVWFAIGWHFTYNFGSMYLYGGPNTGNAGKPMTGHLLDSAFHGPDWLTGGPMGPEASAFIFPVIAALFFAVHRRFRTPEVLN